MGGCRGRASQPRVILRHTAHAGSAAAIASPHGLAGRAHRGRRAARRGHWRSGSGWRSRTGRVRRGDPASSSRWPTSDSRPARSAAAATLRAVLDRVLQPVPLDGTAARRRSPRTTTGVRHVEIDLTRRPDLADRFHVLQTPTTLHPRRRRHRTRPHRRRAPTRTPCRRPPRHPHREVPCPVLNPPASTRAARASRAGITAVLLLVVVVLGFGGADLAALDPARRAEPRSSRGARSPASGDTPSGSLFRRLVRPRLAPPDELEDPRPPTFAQGVGFVVTVVGVHPRGGSARRRGADRGVASPSSPRSSTPRSATASDASSTCCSCGPESSHGPDACGIRPG